MNRKKIRYSYILAWLLFLLLTGVTVFGSELMPHTITSADKLGLVHVMVDGEEKLTIPPLAPNHDYWFGTDHRGYDLLSLLLNGAKYTIGFSVLVAAARFLLAIPIGLYSGTTGRFRNFVRVAQMITTSVPALLLLFPPMYTISQTFSMNVGLGEGDPRLLFFNVFLFGLMVLIGLFPLSHQLAERAHFFNGKEFVTVSRSLGASTGRIMFRHLLPHIRPELLYGFIVETVQVLFLLGQLAILGVFIGSSEPHYFDERNYMLLTRSGEWGSLIAYGTRYLYSYEWILIASALCLAISVLILSFFAHELQKRLDSPLSYQSRTSANRKPRLTLLAAIGTACVVLVMLVQSNAPTAVAVFSNQVAMPKTELDKQTIENTQKISRHLVGKSTEFMQYLADNQWDRAQQFFEANGSGSPAVPPKPVDSWLQALSSKQYQFVRIGRVTKSDNPSKGLFDVEVIVQDKQGQEELWKLVMKNAERIGEVTGGPGAGLTK